MPANCGMAEAGAARARLAGRERHEQQVNDRDRVHGGAGKCNLIYPPNAPNSATRAAAKRVRGRPLSMVLSMKSSRCQPRKTAIGRGRRSIFSTRQQRRGVNASCNRAVRGSSPRVGSASGSAIPGALATIKDHVVDLCPWRCQAPDLLPGGERQSTNRCLLSARPQRSGRAGGYSRVSDVDVIAHADR